MVASQLAKKILVQMNLILSLLLVVFRRFAFKQLHFATFGYELPIVTPYDNIFYRDLAFFASIYSLNLSIEL